jgi:hypothetical protein
MSFNTRLIWLLAACGAIAALSSQVRRKRELEKLAHKSDLREWENEGGNLAPVPEAPAPHVTTAQA